MKEQLIGLVLASVDFNKLAASVVDGKVSKEEIQASINLEGLCDGLLDNVINPLLDKVVADSANPFDDQAKAIVYPIIEKELKKVIDEKIGNNDGK